MFPRYHQNQYLYEDLIIIFRPKRNALFLVDLQLDNQGVHYSNNLTSFETMCVGLFDKGIQSTQSVPQLEKVYIVLTDYN